MTSADSILPSAAFSGEIYVVSNWYQVPEAVQHLRENWSVGIGFDIEWQPDKKSGEDNPPAVIQLCIETVCFVIHLSSNGLRFELHPSLKELLSDSKIPKFAFCFDRADARKLSHHCGVKCAGVFDVYQMLPSHGIDHCSLQACTKTVLGLHLDKGLACSSWASSTLTRAQIMYAATDAYITRRIYMTLKARAAVRTVEAAARFRCDICKVLFTTASDRDAHCTQVGHLRGDYACDKCDRVFPVQHRLWDHTMNAHPVYIVGYCTICDEEFTDHDELWDHMRHRMHCGDCGRQFRSENAVVQHMTATGHYMEEESSDSGDDYDDSDATSEELDELGFVCSPVRWIACNGCQDSFRNWDAIWDHMMSECHCYQCGRTCRMPHALKAHLFDTGHWNFDD
jgi:hypothetical protein